MRNGEMMEKRRGEMEGEKSFCPTVVNNDVEAYITVQYGVIAAVSAFLLQDSV